MDLRASALPTATGLTFVAALLALASAALAQDQVPDGTPLDPIRGPLTLVPGGDIPEVRPGSGFGVTNVSVQIHCTALDAQAPTTVDITVATVPEHYTVTVSPASAVFPANTPAPPAPPCVNAKVVQDVLVFVSVTTDAPAFQAGHVVLTGLVAGRSDSARDYTATAHLNATAGAVVAIDVLPDATSGAATPDAPWKTNVKVTNQGNAKAAVDLAFGSPKGIRLTGTGGEVGSRAAGDPSNEASFEVTATPESTLLNGRYPIWINATGTIPGKPNVRADRSNLQLFVEVTGAATPEDEEESFLPVPVAIPIAAAAGAALWRRRVGQ